MYYISRDEPVHSIYENADFSPKAIKDSIKREENKRQLDYLTKIERNRQGIETDQLVNNGQTFASSSTTPALAVLVVVFDY